MRSFLKIFSLLTCSLLWALPHDASALHAMLHCRFAVDSQDSVPAKHAVIAAKYCQEKNLKNAISEIEIAIISNNEMNEVYTWYTRGYIYKEAFKIQPLSEQSEFLRETSVQSFLQASKLSGVNDPNNDAALKYLAATYLNDALAIISDVGRNDLQRGELFYSKYKTLATALALNSASAAELQYRKAKGQRFTMLWKENRCALEWAYQAIENLTEAANLDPADCVVRYNLGVVYYGLGFDTSADVMECVEEEVRKINQQRAIETLLDAEVSCNESLEIKTALLNIYRFLNDVTNANSYQKKVDEMSSKNSIKSK